MAISAAYCGGASSCCHGCLRQTLRRHSISSHRPSIPPRAASLRKITTWAAVVMALSAVICVAAAFLLSPVANHASSDSSPGFVAVIPLAAVAGLISVALFAGLALEPLVARLWRRSRQKDGPGR